MSSWQSCVRAFWSRRGFGNILLQPLAGLYWLLWHLHRLVHTVRRRPLPVPVIIAGCITAGGGGKTTLVHALVEGMRKHGLTPGVIARGYRSVQRTPRLVDSEASPAEVGDEPAMLARKLAVPVAVGVDRLAVARLLLERHPEVEVIISDDGLQHLALPRQFEIVVISSYGLGNGWLLPAGPLREPAQRLHTVDAIVRKSVTAQTGEYQLRLGTPSLRDVHNNELDISTLAGKRVCALAGIATPAEFFTDVESIGIELSESLSFPDHHPYKAAELAAITADFIIMTPKDAIKCQRFNDARIVEFHRQPVLDHNLLTLIVDCVNRFQLT